MIYRGVLEREVRKLIRDSPIRRVREKLGGSHTVVTYPPLDALEDLDADPLEGVELKGCMDLYFHLIFCEWICDFCHYAKTNHNASAAIGDVDLYLRALGEEFRRRVCGRTSNIKSIYIGGGTPTSLWPGNLAKLLEIVTSAGRPARFCVETSPLTMAADDGEEKLAMLIDAGVNRISIGLQTFTEPLMQRFRGHDEIIARRALERVFAVGVTTNIDLVQDLPGQTLADLEADVRRIECLRPEQVTWYILRLHQGSSMSKSYRRGSLDGVPDTLESAMRRDFIIRAMQGIGYSMLPGCRFSLGGTHTDTYKEARSGLDANLIGIGASAYSRGGHWFFRNLAPAQVRSGLREYVARILGGRTAVTSGARISTADELSGRLAHHIRSTVPVTFWGANANASREALQTLDQLSDLGCVDMSRGGWSLTSLGRLFEEEIASLFYSREVRFRLRERNAYWVPEGFLPPERRRLTHSSPGVLALT
jgi:oxygen-independent coproporphyrinogen-3 oxidase